MSSLTHSDGRAAVRKPLLGNIVPSLYEPRSKGSKVETLGVALQYSNTPFSYELPLYN